MCGWCCCGGVRVWCRRSVLLAQFIATTQRFLPILILSWKRLKPHKSFTINRIISQFYHITSLQPPCVNNILRCTFNLHSKELFDFFLLLFYSSGRDTNFLLISREFNFSTELRFFPLVKKRSYLYLDYVSSELNILARSGCGERRGEVLTSFHLSLCWSEKEFLESWCMDIYECGAKKNVAALFFV